MFDKTRFDEWRTKMNKGLTVKQLFECCKKQIALGNGDKHILISDDDEGNGYHTLFYEFTTETDMLRMAVEIEHDSHDANEIVLLG